LRESAAETTSKDYTFSEVYLMWFDNYKNTVKGSTLVRTSRIFKNHLLPQFGKQKIKTIKPIQVQEYVNSLSKQIKSWNKIIMQLNVIFVYAYKMRIIKENPLEFVIKPKNRPTQENTVNYYTKEELKTFLSCAKTTLPTHWYLFFHLLAYTGLRRGEALALTWGDVDFKERTLKINKTVSRNAKNISTVLTTKTEAGERIIDLDSVTTYKLKQWWYKNKNQKYVFFNSKGSFITPSQPIRFLKKVSNTHGIKYISPHGFRHTHCSMLFASGVSIPQVQKRMGHTDVKTTMNIYNHVYREEEKEVVNKFIDYLGR
jgi:integrase